MISNYSMAFQFKIQIKNIQKPPVWRQILVPENFTFDEFHVVIQDAFGWYNYHLYQFSPTGYGSTPIIALASEDDWEAPDMDAEKTKLKDIFKTENQKYTYIYDFGDDWIHSIILEKILDDKIKHAKCLAGKGFCPPEDCGGPGGYERIKDVLANPDHEEYKDTREWLGLEDDNEVFDPNEFDLESTNEILASN